MKTNKEDFAAGQTEELPVPDLSLLAQWSRHVTQGLDKIIKAQVDESQVKLDDSLTEQILIAADNERQNDLDLSIFHNTPDFLFHLAKLAKNDSQIKEFRVMVGAKDGYHYVPFDVQMGKGTDGQIRFTLVGICSMKGHEIHEDLQKYLKDFPTDISAAIIPTGMMQSPTGCRIFAKSIALKMKKHKSQMKDIHIGLQQKLGIHFKEIGTVKLHPDFYKHGQSRATQETVDGYATIAVNKAGDETLKKRVKRTRAYRYVNDKVGNLVRREINISSEDRRKRDYQTSKTFLAKLSAQSNGEEILASLLNDATPTRTVDWDKHFPNLKFIAGKDWESRANLQYHADKKSYCFSEYRLEEHSGEVCLAAGKELIAALNDASYPSEIYGALSLLNNLITQMKRPFPHELANLLSDISSSFLLDKLDFFPAALHAWSIQPMYQLHKTVTQYQIDNELEQSKLGDVENLPSTVQLYSKLQEEATPIHDQIIALRTLRQMGVLLDDNAVAHLPLKPRLYAKALNSFINNESENSRFNALTFLNKNNIALDAQDIFEISEKLIESNPTYVNIVHERLKKIGTIHKQIELLDKQLNELTDKVKQPPHGSSTLLKDIEDWEKSAILIKEKIAKCIEDLNEEIRQYHQPIQRNIARYNLAWSDIEEKLGQISDPALQGMVRQQRDKLNQSHQQWETFFQQEKLIFGTNNERIHVAQRALVASSILEADIKNMHLLEAESMHEELARKLTTLQRHPNDNASGNHLVEAENEILRSTENIQGLRLSLTTLSDNARQKLQEISQTSLNTWQQLSKDANVLESLIQESNPTNKESNVYGHQYALENSLKTSGQVAILRSTIQDKEELSIRNVESASESILTSTERLTPIIQNIRNTQQDLESYKDEWQEKLISYEVSSLNEDERLLQSLSESELIEWRRQQIKSLYSEAKKEYDEDDSEYEMFLSVKEHVAKKIDFLMDKGQATLPYIAAQWQSISLTLNEEWLAKSRDKLKMQQYLLDSPSLSQRFYGFNKESFMETIADLLELSKDKSIAKNENNFTAISEEINSFQEKWKNNYYTANLEGKFKESNEYSQYQKDQLKAKTTEMRGIITKLYLDVEEHQRFLKRFEQTLPEHDSTFELQKQSTEREIEAQRSILNEIIQTLKDEPDSERISVANEQLLALEKLNTRTKQFIEQLNHQIDEVQLKRITEFNSAPDTILDETVQSSRHQASESYLFNTPSETSNSSVDNDGSAIVVPLADHQRAFLELLKTITNVDVNAYSKHILHYLGSNESVTNEAIHNGVQFLKDKQNSSPINISISAAENKTFLNSAELLRELRSIESGQYFLLANIPCQPHCVLVEKNSQTNQLTVVSDKSPKLKLDDLLRTLSTELGDTRLFNAVKISKIEGLTFHPTLDSSTAHTTTRKFSI